MAAEQPESAPGSDISAGIQGAAGVIALSRPGALNALTAAMRATIGEAFAAWAHDPQVYAAAIVSATDRAFCAGGDVREMVDCGRRDPEGARRMLAAEYALNWQLDCFTKPTVSLIDGVVMGSGVGVTLYGTHRVAGERYRFAMPETGIGLCPDDGVSHKLARMPDEIGMYLALTGRSLGRADAYQLGLVTHCLPAGQFAEVLGALEHAEPVDPVLDQRHVDPGHAELDTLRPAIARCFGGDSVEAVVAALESEREAERVWAEGVLKDLAQRSPTSLKVTYRHVREARGLDLRATLEQDYRLSCRFILGHDFYEGVHAALINRDHPPRWEPARLGDVSDLKIEAYFASLAEGELQLAPRSEMQAVR